MIKIVALAVLALLSAPMQDAIVDLLPPDGTPPGWSRDGAAMEYTASNIGEAVDNPGAFTSNNVQKGVVQWYRKGGSEVAVKIFDMGSNSNAEAVFNAMTAGKEIGADLGGGSVFENNEIMFYSRKFFVHVTTQATGAEASQTLAALAMTVDAYLF